MNDCTGTGRDGAPNTYFPLSINLVDPPNQKSRIPMRRSSSSLPVTRRSSTHRKEWSDTNFVHGAEFADDLQALLSSNYRHCCDSDGDEEIGEEMKEAQKLPNRYVSQEELDALKGCVSKRRALFSPGPSASHTAIDCSKEISHQKSPGHSYSVPLIRKHIVAEKDGGHSRQGSLEYDHLTDFNPHQPLLTESNHTHSSNNMPGDSSVSVQFRLHGDQLTNNSTSQPSQARCSHFSNKYKTAANCSITEFHCNDQHSHGCVASTGLGRSNSSCISLVQSHHGDYCYDPTVRPAIADPWQTSKMPHSAFKHDFVSEAPITTPTRTVQHHSPYHTKFSSPLLSKHQYMHDEGSTGLRMEDHTGSNFSLYSQSTTMSSLNDRPHCSYSKGVDISVFKDRTNMVLKWFCEFSDQQRNMMLMNLLEQCDCAQMHFLSVRMEPVLHDGCPHNCQDLLSWLPYDVISHIFSFLDPVSLCSASLVNKDWYHAAIQPKLWEKFCRLEEWKMSICGEMKFLSRFTSCDGSVKWKDMFGEKYRLRRNWLKGYYNVRTFEGHTQGISCIQFDDTRIVSGSWDKTIKVWNRRTNTVWAALTLAGHSGTVRCLHLHNNRLVSGSSDRTIKVWDLATDKVGWVGAACRATMVGHMHTVRCLQADDNKVISGSYDQTLKVWDIRTGQCQQTLRGHTDAVLCLQFDEEKVVSGSKDKTIKIWSLPSGVCKLTIQGHQAAVSCLHFDETRIISGALDRLIKIWDMNGECIRCIDWIKSEGHTGVVRHLQADSWKIISAADDKTLKVWNVHTGSRLLTLKSHTDGVTCLQFNDEVIVSGSYDKTVKLWDFSVC